MKELTRKKLRSLILEEIEVALDYEAEKRYSDKEGMTVKFSRDQGDDPVGLVPLQAGDRRNKLEVKMSTDRFLEFASEGGSVNEWIKEQIKNGRPLAPPWYDMVYVEKFNIWYVRGHEGRSRCKSIGDLAKKHRVEIPVDLFLKKKEVPSDRAKDLYVDNMSGKMREALKNRVIAQEYTPIHDTDKEHYDLLSSVFPIEIVGE